MRTRPTTLRLLFCNTDHKDTIKLYESAGTPTQHSGMIGWMADGWGIYGRFESGTTLPVDLDECNGHWGDVGGGKVTYHYHTSAYFPFLAGCYGMATKPQDCTLESGSVFCKETSILHTPNTLQTCSQTKAAGISSASPSSGSRGRPNDADGTADCVGQVDFLADSGAITTTLTGGQCMNDPSECDATTHTWVGSLCGDYAGSGSCGCCIEGTVPVGTAAGGGGGGGGKSGNKPGGRILRITSLHVSEEADPSNQVFDYQSHNNRGRRMEDTCAPSSANVYSPSGSKQGAGDVTTEVDDKQGISPGRAGGPLPWPAAFLFAALLAC